LSCSPLASAFTRRSRRSATKAGNYHGLVPNLDTGAEGRDHRRDVDSVHARHRVEQPAGEAQPVEEPEEKSHE